METSRFFKSGMWGKMQIRPNFQKFSQKVKQNICDQTKRSNIKTSSFPMLKYFLSI